MSSYIWRVVLEHREQTRSVRVDLRPGLYSLQGRFLGQNEEFLNLQSSPTGALTA